MTDEERLEKRREYYREYYKNNKAKIDKRPGRRKLFENTYADFIMHQVELAEERRAWER